MEYVLDPVLPQLPVVISQCDQAIDRAAFSSPTAQPSPLPFARFSHAAVLCQGLGTYYHSLTCAIILTMFFVLPHEGAAKLISLFDLSG